MFPFVSVAVIRYRAFANDHSSVAVNLAFMVKIVKDAFHFPDVKMAVAQIPSNVTAPKDGRGSFVMNVCEILLSKCLNVFMSFALDLNQKMR
jgi:site-specific recombinase